MSNQGGWSNPSFQSSNYVSPRDWRGLFDNSNSTSTNQGSNQAGGNMSQIQRGGGSVHSRPPQIPPFVNARSVAGSAKGNNNNAGGSRGAPPPPGGGSVASNNSRNRRGQRSRRERQQRDPSDNVSVGSLGGSTIRSQTSIPSQLPPFGAVPHVTRETVRKTPQTVTFPMGVTSGSGIGGGGGRNAEFFSAPMDTPDAEIQEDVGVICPKHLRGAPGSKDYKYNREAATCSLQHQFGVAKHFVSSITGETEEGNAKEEQHVQDMFVANLSKIEDLDVRLIQFDMKRPFLMSTMKSGVDVDAITHVAELWNDDEIDLIHDWEKIDWDTVLYWQYSINKRCDAVDKDSNKWALQLVFNSCTADL